MNAKVQCKMFSSSTRKWDELVAEASEFASGVGKERLINMSVSASGGTDLFGIRWAGRDLRLVTGTNKVVRFRPHSRYHQ